MNRRLRASLQSVGGMAVVGLVVWRFGTAPIIAGFKTVSPAAALAVAAIAVVTTACAAWRWSIIARGLGISIALPNAILAYYRSQFLNCALPGGVAGDLLRGIRHGRDVGARGRALRAVVWDRAAGQTVQVVLAMIVLLALPSPARVALPIVGCAALTIAGVLIWASRGGHRLAATLRAELCAGLLARDAWPRVAWASVVVVAGHAATFVIATRAVGSRASTATLLPLAMLVLLAMAIPVNLAGWGPREGAAAWVFGVAGLGSAQGVEAATAYGVLVFLASLPGLAVLAVTARGRSEGSAGAAAAVPSTRGARAAALSGVPTAGLQGGADG